jgi:hypothetical protein
MVHELRLSAEADANHRSHQLATQHAKADAISLRRLRQREWSWAVCAVTLSFLSCAAVLGVYSWKSVGPAVEAWGRTYGAILTPSLVCGDGHSLPGGPAIWHVLSGQADGEVAGSAVSPAWSWYLSLPLRLIGPLPVLSCWVVSWVGSLLLWASSLALGYVSPVLLLGALLTACIHGSWLQLLAAGWALSQLCVMLLAIHGVALAVWHITFPKALSYKDLATQYKDVLVSERRGVAPGAVAPTPPHHVLAQQGRTREWCIFAYTALSICAGVGVAFSVLQAAAPSHSQ